MAARSWGAAIQSARKLDAQVRPAPQAEAMPGGHGDLRIFATLAMTGRI
jgi:hypothetical protein